MLPVLVGGARFALGGLGFAQLTLGAGPVADGQLIIVQLQAGHVEAARAAVAQQHWRPLQVVCLRRRVRTRQSALQKTWLVGELLFYTYIFSRPHALCCILIAPLHYKIRSGIPVRMPECQVHQSAVSRACAPCACTQNSSNC